MHQFLTCPQSFNNEYNLLYFYRLNTEEEDNGSKRSLNHVIFQVQHYFYDSCIEKRFSYFSPGSECRFLSRVEGRMSRVVGKLPRVEGKMSRVEGRG